ncbi:MAG TPA: acetate uptake transporter [Frateuria sp.]|uniref:acetate uptake transporter n=1 Tax=Frateuria sp. TaxID=2211372 RepID=UPI002D7E5FEC|nr:acetate uptake transporter [Frateuria sp.]HET6804138.1 acetate uptake transporter [Frateuria sp.]
MATIEQHTEPAAAVGHWYVLVEGERQDLGRPERVTVPQVVAPTSWGNAAPLALAAFAVTTFMLSMINAGLVDDAARPMVYAVGPTFGGLIQVIAGLIVLRQGDTFGGVLFTGFGAFWLSVFAVVEFAVPVMPRAQVGHAFGLFLLGFGIFVASMFAASFRTNLLLVAALADVIVVFALLGIGQYWGNAALRHAGGWLGLVAAALGAYGSIAEICEAAYGRRLPIGRLAKK